jgi:predicted transcriptional regulator
MWLSSESEKKPEMTLRDISEILEAEVICGEERLEESVKCVGASDLMSDVLAFGEPGILLLTGLSNSQSVRTAHIIEASGIIYVRGKKPDKEGIKIAKEKGIPILSTNCMMYKACGLLYGQGLPGVSEHKK